MSISFPRTFGICDLCDSRPWAEPGGWGRTEHGEPLRKHSRALLVKWQRKLVIVFAYYDFISKPILHMTGIGLRLAHPSVEGLSVRRTDWGSLLDTVIKNKKRLANFFELTSHFFLSGILFHTLFLFLQAFIPLVLFLGQGQELLHGRGYVGTASVVDHALAAGEGTF